ncbi:GGDEF domain-containing protein [Desulfobacula sp.]|uniref:GGDEF domain-containing protein n=1 Tax=Desulfobacula sp. TaxID=2593537 RepID=UPI00260F6076|nr:GGDEF domain-containing protein [Desulfobacula sp.]
MAVHPFTWPWSGIEKEGDEYAIDKSGNKYHLHEAAIRNYSGWKVLYLDNHRIAVEKMSGSIFRTAGYVVIGFILTMVVSVFMLYKKASEGISERQELEKRLRDISITDELTELYNRRGFFRPALHQYHIAHRDKIPMRLYYMDIDNLKYINDRYGHQEGDVAISDTARILKETFRKSDILARLGGDEFSALIKSTEEIDISTRIQKKIDTYNRGEDKPFTLSISVGELSYDHEKPMDFDDFVSMADALMYEKKKEKKRN